MLAALTGKLLHPASPVLGPRVVLELTVHELVAAGATDRDLEVMGVRPERTTVRVLWAIDGARLATTIPAFCRAAQNAGIFPRLVGRQGEPLPDGPFGAFAHAVLQGVDLCGDYRGADFSGADLRCAVLRGGNFKGASFVGADLRGADLRGACFEACDAERGDFTGAEVEPAELEREWAGAWLSGAAWSSGTARPQGWDAFHLGDGRAVLLLAAAVEGTIAKVAHQLASLHAPVASAKAVTNGNGGAS